MANTNTTAARIAAARAEGKTFTINFKVCLCFYGHASNHYQTLEGEFYGFRTKAAAKRHLTNSLKHFKADGRVDERLAFFHE